MLEKCERKVADSSARIAPFSGRAASAPAL